MRTMNQTCDLGEGQLDRSGTPTEVVEERVVLCHSVTASVLGQPATGLVSDPTMGRWLVEPSPHLPIGVVGDEHHEMLLAVR